MFATSIPEVRRIAPRPGLDVTGGKDYSEITALVGAPGFQRQAPFLNCFAAPAAKAGIAGLERGQTITVTAVLKNGDAILDNCTWKSQRCRRRYPPIEYMGRGGATNFWLLI